MFSPFVQEKLKYYVYLLIDPRDEQIFYVGKGIGNRVFAHVEGALQTDAQSEKLGRIRAIHDAGLQVRHELLRFGLNEPAAFAVEAAAIQLLGLQDLTNAVAGHHIGAFGRMTTDVAISLFDAPPAPPFTEPTLLVKIPALWYPSMPPEALFEATAGWWVIGPRREQARYACAVHRGVIREVYKIESWRPQTETDRGWIEGGAIPGRRWGFSGNVADVMSHFRNTSVRHLFKRGEAAPVKLVLPDVDAL